MRVSRIKIVPDATPNADGEWITVSAEVPLGTPFGVAADFVEPFIPAGYHVVAFGSREEPAPVLGNRFSGLEL